LVNVLQSPNENERIQNSYDRTENVPLGSFRLKIVEILLFVLKLHKETLYETFIKTDAMRIISELFARYPWNNFL